MRFIYIYHPDLAQAEAPATDELQTQMGRFIAECTASGVLISTGGTCGVSYGTRVRQQGGNVTVVDGPFSEAKELVGGYALFELPSKAAAIEYAQRFLAIVGGGECEVHQLAG